METQLKRMQHYNDTAAVDIEEMKEKVNSLRYDLQTVSAGGGVLPTDKLYLVLGWVLNGVP